MRRLAIGFAAIGVALALRPLIKRRLVQKMSDHCKQMAANCKEMMEGRSETIAPEAGTQEIREHRAEPVVTS